MTHPADVKWPWDSEKLNQYKSTTLKKVENERVLLSYMLTQIQKLDPDIITGHDFIGQDLDILLHRVTVNKIPNWSRLGRLKRGNIQHAKVGIYMLALINTC